MIEQEDKTQHLKWMERFDPAQGRTQQYDVVIIAEDRLTILNNLSHKDI